MGAIFWNVLTAWLGLPSSSSHALIGGMVGAGFAKAGPDVFTNETMITLRKTGVFIIYSPLIGLLLASRLIVIVMWIVHRIRNKHAVNRTFRGLQLVSAAAFSLGHGANDAQKTMGIIAALLIGANKLDASVLDDSGRTAAVDRAVVPRRDRAGHHVRRLEDRQDDGQQAHPAGADGWCLRRVGGRGDAVLRFVQRHPGQHHAHDHGRDRWRRFSQSTVGRAVERRPPSRRGRGCSRFPDRLPSRC